MTPERQNEINEFVAILAELYKKYKVKLVITVQDESESYNKSSKIAEQMVTEIKKKKKSDAI